MLDETETTTAAVAATTTTTTTTTTTPTPEAPVHQDEKPVEETAATTTEVTTESTTNNNNNNDDDDEAEEEIPLNKDEEKTDDSTTTTTITATEDTSLGTAESSSSAAVASSLAPGTWSLAVWAGDYQPARYTASPPMPPEGYVLGEAEWADMLDGSRKMMLLLQARATRKTGELVAGYDDVADEQDDLSSATHAFEQQRQAELHTRAQEPPPTGFWARARASAASAFSSVSYAVGRAVAYVKDEAKRESRERCARRFEALGLTVEELAEAGALIADHYCRAVVVAADSEDSETDGSNGCSGGRAAAGWLFLTERLLIFDGTVITLPGADPGPDEGHVRFALRLSRVATFTGAVWCLSPLGNATGEIPVFRYTKRREDQINGNEPPYTADSTPANGSNNNNNNNDDEVEDAVIVFDQKGRVHQFWDFNSQFGGSAATVLCTFNSVWRNAMLNV